MPNTDAQDAPVASQEAEARYVVRFREDDPCYELVDTVTGSVLVDDGGEPEDRNLYRDFAPLVAELNRVTQLRASERERYARGQHDEPQIKALRGILDAWKAVEDTAHYGGEVREEAERLLRQAIAIARALAALEEAGSA